VINIWREFLSDFNGTALAHYSIIVLRIAAIILGLVVVGWVGRRLIDGLLRPERVPGIWSDRRVQTVRGLAKSLLRYNLYFFGAMMVLSELKINTASLLAGAGIVGLAAGFGAQNLVRDVITGAFILFEDQYTVGDYVTIAGITGIVEDMALRVTRVREFTGELHIVPNGQIVQVTNYSRGGIGVAVDVTVPFDVDLDRVTELVNQSCRVASDANRESVLEEPQVLGVSSLAKTGVTLQVFGKVKPMQQWAFARDLRRRIRDNLNAAGISLT
jgi:small-conductance mechanosensitive channel